MEFLQKLSSDEGGKHSHRDMGGVAATESISQETISASDIEADRPAEPFVRSIHRGKSWFLAYPSM